MYKFSTFFENKSLEFANKSKNIHGDFYGYDKVNYINARTNVNITCPIHGEFKQLPYNHLIGKGCPKCGLDKLSNKFSKSIDKFIEDSRKIHGDKYDYSLTNYINDSQKVDIICPIHGCFEQRPNKHLRGNGCPSCRSTSVLNTFTKKYSKLFPERAHKVHNNKYDYSQTDYVNNREKVKIVCPIHGEFLQNPAG